MPMCALSAKTASSKYCSHSSNRVQLTKGTCNAHKKGDNCSRRKTLGLALGFLTVARPSMASEHIEEGKNVEFGAVNGSLLACPTNVNPNCVSTRSNNKTYSPPWRSNEMTLDATVDKILTSVPRVCPGAELIALKPDDEKQYLAFTVDGLFGRDTVEFLVKPDSTSSRNFEGDTDAPIITYRALAGKVVYLYPIQQPISDLDAQKKRMEAIRQDLGWKIIGCELLECYQ